MQTRPAPPMARRFIVWTALLACHVALIFYFVRPDALLSGPLVGADWDTHVEQCARAIDAFRGYHRSWGYDPHLLAGSLAGTVFDADNKMHEIVVVLLTAVGLSRAAAFNTFVLIAHMSVPLAAYAAARLFDLSRGAATIAGALASALWFFDSSIHWGWWVGSISWAFGAALSPLPVALFYRWGKARTWRWLGATLVLLILTLHIHPYTFFAMVMPMLIVYVREARTGMSAREHAFVLLTAALALLANLWWLRVALRFSPYVLDSAYLGATSLSTLVWDYFGYLDDPQVTGYIAVRTSFRFLTLAAAIIGISKWRKAHDERALILGVAVVLPFALPYLGGHLHALREIQPMRFVFVASFFGAIVAGAELEELRRSWPTWSAPPGGTFILTLCAVVAAPKLALDVWYYFPDTMPHPKEVRVVPKDPVGGGIDNAGLVWGLHRNYGHYPMTDDDRQIVEFVQEHDDGTGRWLVEWEVLGERLAWATDAQVLGGFPYFNMAHSDANWFRLIGGARDPKTLPAYLETYNVGWLIRTWPDNPELERPDLFEQVATIGPHRVYRTRAVSGFVVQGTAQVDASFNRIQVRGSSGGSLVLRYHWLQTLVCTPDCRIEREPVPLDRVGFIRVIGARPDFDIVNAY